MPVPRGISTTHCMRHVNKIFIYHLTIFTRGIIILSYMPSSSTRHVCPSSITIIAAFLRPSYRDEVRVKKHASHKYLLDKKSTQSCRLATHSGTSSLSMSTRSKKLMCPNPTQYCARRSWDMRSNWDSMYWSASLSISCQTSSRISPKQRGRGGYIPSENPVWAICPLLLTTRVPTNGSC